VRAFAEQNYYELLEAPPEGNSQQIERAYRIARATYQPSSTATYSIFSVEECASILRRIEEAYAVLSDDRLRREYDARLRRVDVQRAEPAYAPPPTPIAAARPRPSHSAPAPSADLEFDAGLAAESGVFDGDILRRIRVGLGIELDEIVTTTKINEHHLRAIEGNRYAELPPPVYLRGFLKQIARCLSLDPARVAESYTEKMRESSRTRG
jgi:hypothetical protein